MSDNKHAGDHSETGISRRDFLKFCSTVGLAIGLGPGAGSKVAAALTAANRPPVLWLHFSECTGCTESALRTVTPYFDDLLFDSISLDYHETLMAGAGSAVHDSLSTAAETYKGQFICVVEGAIPTAQDGIFGMINGKTMLSIAQEICPKAKAIIAIGTCASFGGLPAAQPNPTGAKGVKAVFPYDSGFPPIINVSGCPPNPVSFVGVIANYLLNGTLPVLDNYLRPVFAYQEVVHMACPLLHTARCLEQYGCKGPISHNNCTTVMFNNAVNFPMNAGHVCIGCSEPRFWDNYSPFWKLLAADAPAYPDPAKDLWPVSGVMPGRNANTAPLLLHQREPEMFDVLGRRVRAPLVNKQAASKRQKAASGVYFERTIDNVKKTVRKRIGI
jgi:[NiFe] hydrogenase small subunit